MARDAGDIDLVRAAFASPLPEPRGRSAAHGVSAVLLALSPSPEGPRLLYTQRTDTLRSHPGEISFPGGRVDAGDAGPREAALRETEEEVGIAPSDVDLFGHLTDFLTHRDVLVCAYVGALRVAPPTTPRSVAEVASVFTVPIADLLDGANHECRSIEGMGRRGVVHYWRVGGRTIWGITGEITARFLGRVYGWQPEGPARVITDLSQFRP